MPVTPTRLRADLYRILDRILETGDPIEIEHKGKRLESVPVAPASKLANLVPRPAAIRGDPDELVHPDWSHEWKP
ncbi:MAG: type II toxin-antitoxin system Phd/YefM family antitoxin [bacterium]